LNQPAFRFFEAALFWPIAESGTLQNLAQLGFFALLFESLKQPRGSGKAAQRPGKLAEHRDGMVDRLQQSLQLRKGLCRIAVARGVQQFPDRLGSPAAHDVVDQLLRQFTARFREQSQFGQFLVQQAELGADQVQHQPSGLCRQLDPMLRCGPGPQPLDHPLLVQDFVLAVGCLLRSPAFNL